MMHVRICVALAAALLAASSAAPLSAKPAAPKQANSVREWGFETIRHIDTAFWIPSRGLYADEITAGEPPSPGKPAFMWGCGVQLSALNAAARLDKKTYLPEVTRYIAGLQDYWVEHNGYGGYEVLPKPNPADRYYDDNEWIVLDLADAYNLTHDPKILAQAKKTMAFVLSGEDTTLGGGIYWRENKKDSKNTCSNAPAIVGALRLYEITHDPSYLATAKRLYAWINPRLQDTDGLYFDSIGVDNKIGKAKYSYNSALMIRANALFYKITREKRYLAEAQRIAKAAEAKWVNPSTGAISGDAAFAHLLSESFLFLYDQDHDSHHLAVVRGAVVFLHDKVRDANGDYSGNWDSPRKPDNTKVALIADASAARGYLMAAPYLK